MVEVSIYSLLILAGASWMLSATIAGWVYAERIPAEFPLLFSLLSVVAFVGVIPILPGFRPTIAERPIFIAVLLVFLLLPLVFTGYLLTVYPPLTLTDDESDAETETNNVR